MSMHPLSVIDAQGDGDARDDREGGRDEGGQLPAVSSEEKEDDSCVDEGPD